MKKYEAFPSKYITGELLHELGEIERTIADVVHEQLERDGEQVQKPKMRFQDDNRGLIINQTIWGELEALFGPDSKTWSGERVTLYAVRVAVRGERKWGVRIRLPAPSKNAVESTIPPPVADESRNQEAWLDDEDAV